MNNSGFEAFTKRLAGPRLSRRHALRRLGALAAAGVTSPAAAQTAAPPAAAGPAWLVLQAFGAATLRPDPTAGPYTLTLAAVGPAVFAFTDRPARLAGSVPTPDFARAVAGARADPPNAVLAAPLADGTAAVAVVELRAAAYDAAAGTMAYRVAVLRPAAGALTAAATPLAAPAAAQAFGPGHLFVDAVPVPVRVPINVCGNTVDERGDLNPAFGNTCAND